jgi:hypothetical protein
MTTIVHVILTGIVSIIPVPQAQGGGYIVRLQDARSAAMPHYPSLMAVRATVTGASLSTPDASEMLTDGTEVAAWMMPQNGPVTVNSKIRDGAVQIDIPHLLEIAAGCKGVAKCAAAKPATTYSNVDLHITQGTLVTTNLTDKNWYFETELANKSRPLAQELCWTFTIDGSALELDLPGLGTVTVAPLSSGRSIELRLQNTLKDDLIPYPPQTAAKDEHVKLYFELSQAKPTSPPALMSTASTAASCPTHIAHQLDGDGVAELIPEDKVEARDPAAIRINCPPALWK